MFIDGLHNRVAIYNLEHIGTGKLDHDKIINMTPKYAELPCRIIKGEKAIFDQDIDLKQGDVLFELRTQKQYNVKEVKKINGLNGFHHLSCQIDRRRVGDLNERKHGEHTNQSDRLSKIERTIWE